MYMRYIIILIIVLVILLVIFNCQNEKFRSRYYYRGKLMPYGTWMRYYRYPIPTLNRNCLKNCHNNCLNKKYPKKCKKKCGKKCNYYI